MKATIEASAGTGKTYELTTIVAAALCGPDALAQDWRGSGLIDAPEFASLLRGGVLRASELVLVTFTEAATRELSARVRRRLVALRRDLLGRGDTKSGASTTLDESARTLAIERLGAALAEIDSMPIRTIHGFCDGVLREHGFELGRPWDRREPADERALASELAMRWWSRRVRDDPTLSERCRIGGLDRRQMTALALASISSRGVSLASVAGSGMESIAADLMAFARTEIESLCASRGVTTFQDMLIAVRDGLRSSRRFGEVLRRRLKLGVIDEAQDTDPVQLEIFERLFDRRDADARDRGDGAVDRMLVLVGDPKQSIYGFRGADLDAYLRWRGAEKPRRLDTSWRAEPAAVEAVNHLFGGENPFARIAIEHPPLRANRPPMHGTLVASTARSGSRAESERPAKPAPIEIHQGAAGEKAIEWCASTLRSLALRGLGIEKDGETRPLAWRDLAVLGRSNAKLATLDQRLRAEGVPTILLGDRSVLLGETVEDLSALLAACAEPGRPALVRRAMVTPLIGVDAAELAGERGEALVVDWSERLDGWREAARRGGALAIVERAIAECARPIDPREEVDAIHLAELIHAEAGAVRDAGMLGVALERLVVGAKGRMTRPGDLTRRRIERTDAVTLQTMHNAKGLEYGVVLLPWAGDGVGSAGGARERLQVLRLPAREVASLGPDFNAPDSADPLESVVIPLQVDGPGASALATREAEEARRLFYVAVTRARHAVLLFAERRSAGAKPSVLDAIDAIGRADGVGVRVVASRGAETNAVEASPSVASPSGTAPAGAAPTRRSRRRRASEPSRPLRLWLDTSFSGLTSGAKDDEIERIAAPESAGVRTDEPAPVVTGREISGGAMLGRVVHRIFEWAALDGPCADLGAIVSEAIAEAGAESRFDPAILRSMVERTRTADLGAVGGPAVPLGAVPASSLATELDFCLPLGHELALSPARLAAALARAPADSTAVKFAAHAASLSFGEIAGFLRGVIDLLFEHDGRWWIVDYKSNDLGDRDDDYRGASLEREMMQQRYVLQELLYATAARRLLSHRGVSVSGPWLGGVIYPFVRGVDPREPGRGLFIDHPPASLLDSIDELLRAPRAEVVR